MPETRREERRKKKEERRKKKSRKREGIGEKVHTNKMGEGREKQSESSYLELVYFYRLKQALSGFLTEL